MNDAQMRALTQLLSEAGSLEWRTIQLIEEAEILGDDVILDRIKAVRDLLSDVQDDAIVLGQMAKAKHQKR